MEDLLQVFILFFLIFWDRVFAAPVDMMDSLGRRERMEHVVLIDHQSTSAVEEILHRIELNLEHTYVQHVYNNSGFRGFAARLDLQSRDALLSMSDVSVVDPVRIVSHTTQPGGIRPNGPWGLQMISTNRPVTGSASALSFNYSYIDPNLGKDSDIYIIDSGIYTENSVFGSRASMLWSFDDDMDDENGHGTHVSGIAGGNLVGVASNANLFGLKVLDKDGDGSTSNVVAAIDKVIQIHDSRKSSLSSFRGSVISMSLSTGGDATSINQAVQQAIARGIHVCVAAGNYDANACAFSPSSQGGIKGNAISIGAIDMNGAKAGFSNYGSDCVDVYAPGINIISAWIGGPSMLNMLSGTSMAAPYVTGLVAYAMANDTLAGDPALMKEWIRSTAITSSEGLLLANNGLPGLDVHRFSNVLDWRRHLPKLGYMLDRFSAIFRIAHVYPRLID